MAWKFDRVWNTDINNVKIIEIKKKGCLKQCKLLIIKYFTSSLWSWVLMFMTLFSFDSFRKTSLGLEFSLRHVYRAIPKLRVFLIEKFRRNKDSDPLLIDICRKLSIKNSFVINYFDNGVPKALFDGLSLITPLNLIPPFM